MANKKTSDYAVLPGGAITSTWLFDIANPGVVNYKGTLTEVSQNVADETITGMTTTATDLVAAVNELDAAMLRHDGTVALTADWDAGSFKITAETLESDIATGTAPIIVASTTKVANLNVDQVDGFDMDQAVLIASSPTHVGMTLSGLPVAGGIVQTDGAGVFSSSVTLPDGTLATTQAPLDGSTKLATTAYADSAAAAVVAAQDTYDATAAQVNFTLSQTPSGAESLGMYINGQLQPKTSYSFIGTAFTYGGSPALVLNDKIVIWYDWNAPSIGSLDQVQVYYVGGAGSDSNDGKSIEKPFLTLTAAAAAVVTQTPAEANRFEIKMIGSYRWVGSVTLPTYTTLSGAGAIVVGNVTLGSNASIDGVSINGTLIKSTGGNSYTRCPLLQNTSGIVINRTGSGKIYVDCDHFVHAGATAGIVNNIAGGFNYYNIKRMESSGTGNVIDLNGNAGACWFNIDSAQHLGASGALFKIRGNHTAYVKSGLVSGGSNDWLDIGGTSFINITSGRIIGTVTDDASGNGINIVTDANPSLIQDCDGTETNVTGGGTLHDIKFATEVESEFFSFNPSSGVATLVSEPGTYLVTVDLQISVLNASHTSGNLIIVTTGGNFSLFNGNPYALSQGGLLNVSFNRVIKLSALDTLKTTLQIFNGADVVNIGNTTRLSVNLLRRGA